MKKRELRAVIERQAAEIADLRRRVEELEARPIVDTITVPEVGDGSLTIEPNDGWIYWPPMWHGITPPPRYYHWSDPGTSIRYLGGMTWQ